MAYAEPKIDSEYSSFYSNQSSGELGLIANFFKLCIDDYVSWKRKGSNKHRKQTYGATAELWIFNPPPQDYPFSFVNCCLYLDLDPERLRNEILKRAEEPNPTSNKVKPSVVFGRRIGDMSEDD